MSHSARSAWIETMASEISARSVMSHSARSAWIETPEQDRIMNMTRVALRKECVD